MLERGRFFSAPSLRKIVLSILLAGGGCGQAAPPPAKTAASPAPAAAPAPQAVLAPAGPVIGPPLVIVPAAEARPWLLVSVSIPSVDRTLASGTALVSRAIPLTLDAASVKEMLLTQAGLPPKVGENLDTAAPSGAAVVAIGNKEQASHAGLVMAIPAKGSAEAGRVIAALGHVISKRGAALEIDNGSGGRGWVWPSGSVLVISDSIEALGRGAMLALEARLATTSQDVTAVLHPEAIARANGTDLKSGLALMVAGARAEQATKRAAGAPPDQLMAESSLDLLESVAAYLPDADAVEIGLAVSGDHGLLADVRLRPRAGTGLEKLAQEVHPFEIDPALSLPPAPAGGSGDIAFAGASSYGPFFREQLAKQRGRLQASHDKGAADALKVFDTWSEAIAGPWSGVGRLKPGLSVQVIYQLKDAAAGAKLAAGLGRLDSAAALALWKTQVGLGQQKMFDWKVKRETVGKMKALHFTLGPNAKAMTPGARDAVKSVLGESALEAYVAVAGTRLVAAVGKDGKAQLGAVGSGKPLAAKGGAKQAKDATRDATRDPTDSNREFSVALADARGKDSFGYLDLGKVLGLVTPLLDDPRAAMLAGGTRAPIPTYGTYATDGQGRVMTLSLTLPPSAFSGVGTILQGLAGAGGGGK